MSTFIYQHGKLYADTRKIVNFPGKGMHTTAFESKVRKYDWCYVAFSGFEVGDLMLLNTLKIITALECLEHFHRAFAQLPLQEDFELQRDSILISIETIKRCFLEGAGSLYMSRTFLAVTKNAVYTADDTGEDGYALLIQSLDSMAAAGAGSYAARSLLLAGLAPVDIYPILRAAKTPTGEKCEVFSVQDLKRLAPPWLDINAWIYLTSVAARVEKITEKEKLAIADIFYTVFTGLRIIKASKNKLMSPDTAKMVSAVEGWKDKSFRQLAAYKLFQKNYFQ